MHFVDIGKRFKMSLCLRNLRKYCRDSSFLVFGLWSDPSACIGTGKYVGNAKIPGNLKYVPITLFELCY